jgi:hypothetical protein
MIAVNATEYQRSITLKENLRFQRRDGQAYYRLARRLNRVGTGIQSGAFSREEQLRSIKS